MIKPAQKIFLTLCAVALALPVWGASERAETLRAINWVENPTNHTRRGSRGELGPYQFMPQTWRLHTRTPFAQAIVREQADAVAVRHYEWICDGLREAGIDPSPYNVALAWNCGLGAVKSGRVPAVSYAYAQRVQNLVEHQRAQLQAQALASSTAEMATQTAVANAAHAAEPAEPPMFNFDPHARTAPRFVVATTEPLYEPALPVIVTEKTKPAAVAVANGAALQSASAAAVATKTPTITVEDAPMFTIGTVTQPRFALIR